MALLNRLSRIASGRGPARVQIIMPNSVLGTQDVAIRYGFMRCSGSDPAVSRYQRLSIGGVVDAISWPSVRQNLQVTANMRFTEDLASIADDEQRIQFQNQIVRWVIDICVRPHDRTWLDYQEEIGLRHTPQKKNQTDH
jgi:hypothetical protein